jgi:hypothetical protein
MTRFFSLQKSRSRPLNTGGIATPGCLFLLVLIAIGGFAGFKFGEAYWTYYQVREQVRQALTWTVAGDPKPEAAIVQRVISQVRDAEVQLTPRNIRITQTSDSLTLIVSWTQEVEFPSYTYPLAFEVSLTEIKRWGRGGLVIK